MFNFKSWSWKRRIIIGGGALVASCFVCLVIVAACAPTRSSNVGTLVTTSTPHSPQPTAQPNAQVTSKATSQATAQPTVPPTVQPTVEPTLEPTAIPPTRASTTVYKVGDVIKVKNHTIVLNSAIITNNILKANFTLINEGNEDVNVSSLVSFNARDNDGVNLKDSMFDCGSSFDGTVLSGDKLKGDICWKITGATPYRLYYEANLFGSGALVWEIK